MDQPAKKQIVTVNPDTGYAIMIIIPESGRFKMERQEKIIGEIALKKVVNRFIVFLIMIFVTLMLVISSFMIAKHIHHHCTGKDCPVCQGIIQCFNNVRLLGNVGNTPVLSWAFVTSFMVTLIFAVRTVSNKSTLISLKVEFLN